MGPILIDVLWPVALLGAMIIPVYPLMVFGLARLRLTDWLGYVSAVATIIVLLLRLVDASVWWLAGAPFAVLAGYLWARMTVRRYRTIPTAEIRGVFVVGKPGERVRDWPDWSRSRGSDDASNG